MRKYKIKITLTQIAITISFLMLWELGTKKGIINSFIFSSPSKIIDTLISLIKNGELMIHIFSTLKEVVISFSSGIIIAFILSILMYLNKFFADTIEPFLTILNSLPKVALGPIIIIWVGANTNAIITMALLINVIISIITIYNGFIHTDEQKIKLFKTFKATKLQILTKLVIPENFATIISAFKINISLTLIGVLMGEFLVSKSGVGYLILYGTQVFNLNLVMTGILVLIFISYMIYKLVEYFEKHFNR